MPKKPPRKKVNIDLILQEVLAAYQTCEFTAEDNVERLAAFGTKWNELKPMIPATGLTIGEYAKQHLPFSHQYANRCGALAKQLLEFDDAYKWFKQSGIALGYPPLKSVGSADWALTLIKYRKLDKDGKGPPQPSNTARKPPRNAQSLIASYQETTERLVAELGRVVRMLAATEEGRGFESQVLNAVTAEARDTLPRNDASRPSRDTEADESDGSKPDGE